MANNQFNLTLDTLAPTGSITRPQEYSNTNRAFTITVDSAHKADTSYMKVWWDKSSTSTAAPSSWEAIATSKTSTMTAEGIYYGHVQFMDTVGNISSIYHSARYVYDTTKPVIGSLSVARKSDASKTVKKGDTIGIAIYGMNDSGTTQSGLQTLTVTISGAGCSNTWTVTPSTSDSGGYYTNLEYVIPNTATNGTATISASLKDKAGNISNSLTASLTVDVTGAKATLSLVTSSSTADASTTLPTYVKDTAFKARIDVTDTVADVVGYRIWGDISGKTTKPTSWTDVTKGIKVILSSALNFLSGDGLKTVHAEVIDQAGNITVLTDQTRTLDQTIPNCSISIGSEAVTVDGKAYLAPGHPTCTISVAWSGDVSSYAEDSSKVTFKVNNTTITRATRYEGTILNDLWVDSFTLNTTNMVEGANTLTLSATDKAGNIGTKTATIYYDSISPSVTDKPTHGITNDWLNPSHDAHVVTGSSSDSGSGLSHIKVWSSNIAGDTGVPASAKSIIWNSSSATMNVQTSDISFNLVAGLINYIHVATYDKVGNVSYSHSLAFGYDNAVPTVNGSFSKAHYNTTAATVKLSFSDTNSGSAAASGVFAYKLTRGDVSSEIGKVINLTTAQINQGYANVSVTLTATIPTGASKADKTIYFQVMDKAGNWSTEASAMTCYDISAPGAEINLLTAGSGETDKPATSADPTFKAKIYYTGAEDGTMKYQVYGDFTFNAQSDTGTSYVPDPTSSAWIPYIHDSGKTYKILDNMYCTLGGGDKNIYVRFMDAAENISDPAVDLFSFDDSVPEPKIVGEYSRISCVHSLRMSTATTPVSNKYNDEVILTVTPSKQIQAYKIVAYKSIEDAKSGTYLDAAVGTTYGSINMEQSGLYSDSVITSKITGKDYRKALGGTETVGSADGAHVLVIYVQDVGGQWSGTAEDIYLLFDKLESQLFDNAGESLQSEGQ